MGIVYGSGTILKRVYVYHTCFFSHRREYIEKTHRKIFSPHRNHDIHYYFSKLCLQHTKWRKKLFHVITHTKNLKEEVVIKTKISIISIIIHSLKHQLYLITSMLFVISVFFRFFWVTLIRGERPAVCRRVLTGICLKRFIKLIIKTLAHIQIFEKQKKYMCVLAFFHFFYYFCVWML